MLYIIYRLSDSGYAKEKPDYINNEKCLKNALKAFPPNEHKWLIIADNTSDETYDMLLKYVQMDSVLFVQMGSGAQTFNIALDKALKLEDEDIVYFIENDYIWIPGAGEIAEKALDNGADYFTSYIHPDKYLFPNGNPEVDEDGGYLNKMFLLDGDLFFTTNSTTMTFAAKVKTLKEDETIIRYHTAGTYPNDYKMFLNLRDVNRVLLCSVNPYSSHGESLWLAPLPGVKKENLIEEWGKFI